MSNYTYKEVAGIVMAMVYWYHRALEAEAALKEYENE